MSLRTSLSLAVLSSSSLGVLASPVFMDTSTSTGVATPTSAVKRALDGPKARRGTPSCPSVPAPDFLNITQDAYPFVGGPRSSGTLVSPYFEPSWGFYIQKTTYPPSTPPNTVLQSCLDLTHTRPTSFYFNDDG
ncbi:hypothetical protein I302_105629 [Kwoniella bestiolae CBS 10118]|uniref:Uncharacterized protein n=1 Tax=Kwoniella bestiolae CBS 10118 TaxID=1296100 RepID=A0A1B9G1N7_9TREE|nr:hypothetical protein I302_04747 [Kwoniella bestiolae CBS 10118]OCF24937.1 hypothetical protein I302_04747 [Kwoniella bestiolae CBS 10118]